MANTMRAAFFLGDGEVELRAVPIPVPGKGELLVRVAANGVCGSDRKVFQGGSGGRIPGHEVVGAVDGAGTGCSTPPGTRVAIYIPMHCGVCEYCRGDRQNICPERRGLLGWSTDGGYAEYIVVPERNALPLADDVSFGEGVALLDTLGTAGHGLRLAGGCEAESALIMGAGPLGVGAVTFLKAFGARDIFVSEPSPYRRDRAAELGAIPLDPASDDLEAAVRERHPHGVDLVVEAAGRLDTIWQALDLVRPGGAVNILGEYGGRVELQRLKGTWMLNDMTIIRSFYFTIGEFKHNQRMVSDDRLPARELVTHEFPLERIEEALDLFFTANALKVLVKP